MHGATGQQRKSVHARGSDEQTLFGGQQLAGALRAPHKSPFTRRIQIHIENARMKCIRKVFVQATFPLLSHDRRVHSGNRINQLADTDHTDEDLLVTHLAFPRDHRV